MSLASTSTKISRMSFPRASIDMLLAKARRFSSKTQQNGVVQQTPMSMSLGKQDTRRDSNQSQGTRTTSFISSVASINSQTVVKVDITPPNSKSHGRGRSSPNGRPHSLPEGQRRLVTAVVVNANGIDDNSNDCLAPLMYCDKIEADVSAVTTEMEMCTGLSPIAEADSSA